MGDVDNLFLSLGHSFASLEYDLSRGPVLPKMLKMIFTNLQIFGWEIAYNDSRCFKKLIFPSLRSFLYSLDKVQVMGSTPLYIHFQYAGSTEI